MYGFDRCAGIAQMKPSVDFDADEIEKTIRLNCNVPVPFINLYAATKAFEHSYSRALNIELKSAGITVTAVSPGWVDTDMLSKEINGKTVRFPGMVNPKKVARKAIQDAKKGKDVSICSFYVKCQHLNVKLMPHKYVMRIWMHGIKKYL